MLDWLIMLRIIKNMQANQVLFHKKYLSKNVVAIQEIKPVLTLDKPIYVGFSVLELSKCFTYNFHYNYIKRKYNAKLLFTDTDSLVYEIETDDVYEDFYKDKCLFHLSNYPKDSKDFDSVNEKIIGKMKDESKGKINDEFVGLNLKMRSMKNVDGKENQARKGVNKIVVKKIKHEEYIDVLYNKKWVRHNMKRIQSKLHKIRTYDVSKISLSCYDDKRYILDDGISTLAYFHKDIRSQ